MWKAFSRPAMLQWYTVVANSHQNAETIFVLTFGSTRFWSLFFDLAFQNETLYKVPSSRKSEKKRRGPQLQQLPPSGENLVKNSRPWILISTTTVFTNWRARCKNGLRDHFGPPFTKPPNYLLSCKVTVAKWIVSCSQHIVLVIWIEFPPKLYQVTLLLARKEKLPKCQEIPIISAGGKKQFCCCPWWVWV